MRGFYLKYRSFHKSDRIQKIQIILATIPDGIQRSELSRRLGVSRATISRDIAEMSIEYPIREDEKTHKLSLDRVSLVNNLYLTTEEIQSLHLACRLLGRKLKFHYPTASSALRKLGVGLESYAPFMTRFIIETAELFELHNENIHKNVANIIQQVTAGIINNKIISFERFSRKTKDWHITELAPYCIEPYAEGNSLYLIGKDQATDEMRTYKLELLRNITLTNCTYTIPKDFSINSYFHGSWGIWTSEGNPQRVVLRFSHTVKIRVQQTEWHVSEELDEVEDGKLIWKAMIDEPREMLPWIRGWGADVEVLEPAWVRTQVIEDLKRQNELYR